MVSILLVAIGTGIATALLGSMGFQFLTPINDLVLSPLEEKCQLIANEGYKIQAIYPNSSPDQLPTR